VHFCVGSKVGVSRIAEIWSLNAVNRPSSRRNNSEVSRTTRCESRNRTRSANAAIEMNQVEILFCCGVVVVVFLRWQIIRGNVSVEGRVDRTSSWWQRRGSVSWLLEEVYLLRVKLLVYGALGSIIRAARCSAVRAASDDWNAILVVLEQETGECVPLR
jgi:hypothetical protein